jgi:AcrR family transcriptional regulator
MPTTEREGARAISKRAIFTRISDAARELLDREGYEATSVDAIAVVAGISTRMFYRYFSSKEEIVLSWLDDVGPDVRARVADRPDGEHILESLRRSLDPFSHLSPLQLSEFELVGRLVRESASLYAASLERWNLWERQLADVVHTRIADQKDAPRRARMYAAFAMAGLRVCYEAAAAVDHDQLDRYLDEYFALTTNV